MGGLIGGNWHPGDFTITSSYWDTETSGQAASQGGTGKTTQEMMNPAAYSGWDFTTVGDGTVGGAAGPVDEVGAAAGRPGARITERLSRSFFFPAPGAGCDDGAPPSPSSRSINA